MELNAKSGFFVLGVVVLAVAVLAFSLQSDDATSVHEERDSVLASVDGVPVFSSEVRTMQENVALRSGNVVDEEEILERVIDEKLLLSSAEEAGFVVTLDDAENQLLELATSRGVSLDDVKSNIVDNGADYEAEIESFRRQVLIGEYLGGTIPVPEVSDDDARSYYNENRATLFTGEVIVPYEQLAVQLKQVLAQQEYQQRVADHIADLRKLAAVEYSSDSDETVETTSDTAVHEESSLDT